MATTSGLKVSCVCGWTGTVAARLAGKLVRCPRCSGKVRVTTFVPAPEPEPEPVAWEETRIVEGEKGEQRFDWKETARGAVHTVAWLSAPLVALAAVGVAWSTHTGAEETWIYGHVAILALPFVLAWRFGAWIKLRWNWYVAAGLAAVAIGADWWHASTASFEFRWNEKELHYTDYFHRGARFPYFRKFFDRKTLETAQGGFAEDASKQAQHGPWEFTYRIDLMIAPRHKWYWYGEEITEGEWHLRSKR